MVKEDRIIIEVCPADDDDIMGLLSEAKKELKSMLRQGSKKREIQYCSGAIRITIEKEE